jgi:pyruvate formate lyase activating enzyme
MWLRFVVLPGYTDKEEDVEKMAKFVSGLGICQRIDIMPFHQMGRFKWERLGLNYALNDVEPPSSEVVERVREQFRAEGLEAY